MSRCLRTRDFNVIQSAAILPYRIARIVRYAQNPDLLIITSYQNIIYNIEINKKSTYFQNNAFFLFF